MSVETTGLNCPLEITFFINFITAVRAGSSPIGEGLFHCGDTSAIVPA
jgi:hypothetical protein